MNSSASPTVGIERSISRKSPRRAPQRVSQIALVVSVIAALLTIGAPSIWAYVASLLVSLCVMVVCALAVIDRPGRKFLGILGLSFPAVIVATFMFAVIKIAVAPAGMGDLIFFVVLTAEIIWGLAIAQACLLLRTPLRGWFARTTLWITLLLSAVLVIAGPAPIYAILLGIPLTGWPDTSWLMAPALIDLLGTIVVLVAAWRTRRRAKDQPNET
ncbi:hypothetical protein [Leifsonia sp. AG29]|uniref:hypothetical protein n=1 Tax=Leifsonia sp. AG29 TaxID=2598860 RepID=UPI00131BBD71|nr:hypothetical protein [Leifsonia sp. AG29]